MKNIEFFKKQAKYLLKDWNTRSVNPGTDEEYEDDPYLFERATHFNMYNMVQYYEFGDDFGLMKAQHIIAQLAGYKKWDDLQKANEDDLALARIVFTHLDPENQNSWNRYCRSNNWDVIPMAAKFRLAKRLLYDTRSNYVNVNYSEEELFGIEREVVVRDALDTTVSGLWYNPEGFVTCTHCFERYPVRDLRAFHTIPDFGIRESDSVFCKSYPSCMGSVIDFRMDSQEDFR